MASCGGLNSQQSDSIGVDAGPESQSRTTGKPNKPVTTKSTNINIGNVKNVAIDSTMNITKTISKKQSGQKAVGIFWDIQNCTVPHGKSVLHLIDKIRKMFVTQEYEERPFICVLDSSKESAIMKEDLNKGNVTVQDVPAGLKNAADEKIKQQMRHFVDTPYPPGSKLVLISSDINFADDLSYIKNTKKLEVILVHKPAVSEALLQHVSSHVLFTELTDGLPDRDGHVVDTDVVVVVDGYKFSSEVQRDHVKDKLESLIQRWQGSLVKCDGRFSIIKVADIQTANELIKNLQNEEVKGQKIQFKLLEESEHRETIQNMMAKNKSGGGDSNTRKDNSERGASKKNTQDTKKAACAQPKDNSTDQQGPHTQPSDAHDQATQIFQKNTRGQFVLEKAGIFWDMETCPVPTGSTVLDVIDAVREACVDDNYSESELVCFCDVLKAGDTLKQLQKLMIKTVHTFADPTPVIQRSLLQFAEMVPLRSRLILISNNAGFLHFLDHHKNVKKFQIFLIHVNIDSPALARRVSKCFTLEEIIAKDDDASADNA